MGHNADGQRRILLKKNSQEYHGKEHTKEATVDI